jgi:hypothetical protein
MDPGLRLRRDDVALNATSLLYKRSLNHVVTRHADVFGDFETA